jgi:hypothetical protein
MEFLNNDLSNWFKMQGILHLPTPTHTPEYNGVVEQYNSTFLSALCTFLNTSGLECQWWGEAAHTAIIVYNLLPHSANLENQSPMEMWTGEVLCLDHIHVFSSPVHVLVPLKQCNKLDNCSRLAIYLGPARSSTGHDHP